MLALAEAPRALAVCSPGNFTGDWESSVGTPVRASPFFPYTSWWVDAFPNVGQGVLRTAVPGINKPPRQGKKLMDHAVYANPNITDRRLQDRFVPPGRLKEGDDCYYSMSMLVRPSFDPGGWWFAPVDQGQRNVYWGGSNAAIFMKPLEGIYVRPRGGRPTNCPTGNQWAAVTGTFYKVTATTPLPRDRWIDIIWRIKVSGARKTGLVEGWIRVEPARYFTKRFSVQAPVLKLRCDGTSFGELGSGTRGIYAGSGAAGDHLYSDAITRRSSLQEVLTYYGSAVRSTTATAARPTATAARPTAAFSASSTLGATPLTVQFIDESADGGEEIASHSWDFDGDGAEDSNERSPSFTYEFPGVYTVSLTVANALGEDTATMHGLVTVADSGNPKPPVVEFAAAPPVGPPPLAVEFTNFTEGAHTYEWDFEDDGIVDSTLPSPVHIYAFPGHYSVRLRVSGFGGTVENVLDGAVLVGDPPDEDSSISPPALTVP